MENKDPSNNHKKSGLFDRLLFIAGISFFIFFVYLTAYSFKSGFEFAPLLFITTSIILALIYYLLGLRKKRNTTIQQILEKKMNSALDTSLDFFNGIFIVVKFLLKVALAVALVGLVIWIIVALGPFWIIAIVLVLIFLILLNR